LQQVDLVIDIWKELEGIIKKDASSMRLFYINSLPVGEFAESLTRELK